MFARGAMNCMHICARVTCREAAGRNWEILEEHFEAALAGKSFNHASPINASKFAK